MKDLLWGHPRYRNSPNPSRLKKILIIIHSTVLYQGCRLVYCRVDISIPSYVHQLPTLICGLEYELQDFGPVPVRVPVRTTYTD